MNYDTAERWKKTANMGLFSRSSSSGEKDATSPSASEQDHDPTQPQYPVEGHDDDLHVGCPPHTTERKLMTRIDLHVLPCVCVLYLLAFLDRVNISNANVFGLAEDLNLVGNEYNTALVIFFVPYILFEVSNESQRSLGI